MAQNVRDGLPWSKSLELLSPIIPNCKEASRRKLPDWVQPQQPPMLPDFELWNRLTRGSTETDQTRPSWIQPPLPLPGPGPGPFPGPAPLPQQTPPTHEVDPPGSGSAVTDIRSEPAGALLGLLENAMRHGERRNDARLEPRPRAAPPQIVSVQPSLPVRRLALTCH